eukprot:gene11387-12573_t
MALPFLPGNSFNKNLGKDKFNKSQCFDYRNDVSVYVGEHKSGIGGEALPGGKKKPKTSVYPNGIGSQAPAWVAFDRQVLCFDAYFQEAVHEKREEQYRIRKCKIYFYLEDDSIQVIEPKIDNIGIPQGTLIRRHRIPLPSPHDDEFYNVEHFNVGKEMKLYSKTFHITGCDEFTNNFLKKLGVRVKQPSEIPTDPYTGHREKLTESMQPLRPYEKLDTLRQFLENDRKVLRFYCLWDDCDSMFGDPREMVLHYFLADDTVEIREIIPANSGRDAVPLFLKRQPLPKLLTPLNQPGQVTKRTVLNVFGPMGQGGRYILDSLKTGAVHTDFYHDSDLVIGAEINVWGRRLVVCDCDDFTKQYYKTKYGVDEFAPVTYKADPTTTKNKEIPPYNGFGSEEDSLCNCVSLIPKPPKRDFIKFMEKDRYGLESNVLRFVAKMDTTRPIDMDRRFIVSYFLSDDTILVFEPPQRNSGIIGGKFLERRRIKKPDDTSYYTAKDLYIGSRVAFSKHAFILIDADEYAIRYMESHPILMQHSDLNAILPKLSQLPASTKDELKQFIATIGGQTSFDQFMGFFAQHSQDVLTEHEIIILARHFGEKMTQQDDIEVLVATVQEELRKVNYESFSVMMDACVYQDEIGSGFIPMKDLWNITKSFNVPIKNHLLELVIANTDKNEADEVNYKQFINFLNWRDYPVMTQKFKPSLAYGVNIPDRIGPKDGISKVHLKPLMDALGMDSE